MNWSALSKEEQLEEAAYHVSQFAHCGQIKCPCCGLWQDDKGQTMCDRYGCNELFERDEE